MVALAHPLVELKDETSTVVTTNTYDGLNRKIIRDETGGSGDKIHYYYNENWQVLTESDGTNATAVYSYHPHYIDAVAVKVGPTTGHFYLHDANFNVTAAVDINQSSKPIVERYHYSPYGEVTYLNPDFSKKTTQSSAIGNELLYTGRRLDPETGLQLNRNRFYHPQLGRWINVDPIGYRGGLNLYGYVGGMPTRAVDPLGLDSIALTAPTIAIDDELGMAYIEGTVGWDRFMESSISVIAKQSVQASVEAKVTASSGLSFMGTGATISLSGSASATGSRSLGSTAKFSDHIYQARAWGYPIHQQTLTSSGTFCTDNGKIDRSRIKDAITLEHRSLGGIRNPVWQASSTLIDIPGVENRSIANLSLSSSPFANKNVYDLAFDDEYALDGQCCVDFHYEWVNLAKGAPQRTEFNLFNVTRPGGDPNNWQHSLGTSSNIKGAQDIATHDLKKRVQTWLSGTGQ